MNYAGEGSGCWRRQGNGWGVDKEMDGSVGGGAESKQKTNKGGSSKTNKSWGLQKIVGSLWKIRKGRPKRAIEGEHNTKNFELNEE